MLNSKLIQLVPVKDSDSMLCAIVHVTGTSNSGKECDFYNSNVLDKSRIHVNVGDNVRIISVTGRDGRSYPSDIVLA